jgi:hypothetical protein
VAPHGVEQRRSPARSPRPPARRLTPKREAPAESARRSPLAATPGTIRVPRSHLQLLVRELGGRALPRAAARRVTLQRMQSDSSARNRTPAFFRAPPQLGIEGPRSPNACSRKSWAPARVVLQLRTKFCC